jgi:hypothetical protein
MKARHLVVVLLAGGVRAADTITDPQHRYVPRLWNDLVPRGTLHTALYNDGWTNHGPSLTAVATGRWETRGYMVPEETPGRTLVDAARRHGRTTLVISPPKDERLFTGGDVSHLVEIDMTADAAPFASDDPGATLYALRSFDRAIVAAFLALGARPDLTVLLFEDTDIAHQARWSRYAASIRQADALLWTLWQRLEADGDTDLLVLPLHGRPDHGQTRWGFLGHGRWDEGCTHLWMLGLGPDFAPGRVVERRARLIDVPPTIARLLGFDFPCRGRALTELFA